MSKRPPKRRRYLVVIPYVLIVAVILVLNAVLPSMDPTLDVPFTKPIVEDGIQYRQINRAYLAPFFPAGSPMVPELRSTFVLETKTQHSFRVLCLGESSMFGVPFQFSATIPALVRKQLRYVYPESEIEVINLGASAINTNVIRAMVPDVLSLHPDLVLMYTGHNEFYGPEGVSASWLDRHVPGYTQAKYALRRQPLVMGFQKLIGRMGSAPAAGERNLMKQVSGGATVMLESPDAERVFTQFNENLTAILNGFAEKHVPVILADISSNLMFPPFAPAATGDPDPVQVAIAARQFHDADVLVDRVLSGDPSNAYGLYWRGRLSLARGDSAAAIHLLELARDNDLLKFRAPGRINAIIHEAGRAASVPVLAIDSLLRARSPHGITDSVYFSEHLHPTFAGYDLIARAFVRSIMDRRLVPSTVPPPSALLPFDADSLSVPWLDLAYGAIGMRNLTSRWPFTGMPPRDHVLRGREPWEMKIVNDVYGGTKGWTDALLQYAYEAHQHKKDAAMVTSLAALVEEYPWTYPFRYGLAGALEAIGKTDDAIAQYEIARELRPEFVQACVDMAGVLLRVGRVEEARVQLHAFFADPANKRVPTETRAKAYYELAAISASGDSVAQSMEYLGEALRLSPGYQPALALQAQLQGGAR
jgi:tetratricopeptide (TPR) repeat protein